MLFHVECFKETAAPEPQKISDLPLLSSLNQESPEDSYIGQLNKVLKQNEDAAQGEEGNAKARLMSLLPCTVHTRANSGF